ncbi:MAG: universal stress protein [Coriobacteriales bacterium]
MFDHILVCFDNSEPSKRAIEKAVDLALACKASLEVIKVVPSEKEDSHPGFENASKQAGVVNDQDVVAENDLEYKNAQTSDLEQATSELLRPARDAGMDIEQVVIAGNPKEDLAKYVNEGNYDLVVMGRRGLGAVSGLIGSVSQRVLWDVEIPVMLVR